MSATVFMQRLWLQIKSTVSVHLSANNDAPSLISSTSCPTIAKGSEVFVVILFLFRAEDKFQIG